MQKNDENELQIITNAVDLVNEISEVKKKFREYSVKQLRIQKWKLDDASTFLTQGSFVSNKNIQILFKNTVLLTDKELHTREKGIRKDRFGNEIIKGSKVHCISYNIDNFVESIEVENYKEFNKKEEYPIKPKKKKENFECECIVF